MLSPPSLQNHLCLGGNLAPEKPAANSPDPAASGLKEPEASFDGCGVPLTSFKALAEGKRGNHTTAMTKEIISVGFSKPFDFKCQPSRSFFSRGLKGYLCIVWVNVTLIAGLGLRMWGKLNSLEMDNHRIVFQFCILFHLFSNCLFLCPAQFTLIPASEVIFLTDSKTEWPWNWISEWVKSICN